MFDMLVLAFQTDSTRIATMLLAGEGSNRTFPELDISEGHHNLTHHQNREDMIEKVKAIDLWYTKQLAKFLNKMDQTKDTDGQSLLHNSMIVYGSGNADGDRHTHSNLPILLAGAGGGTLKPGRYVKAKPAPLTNLLLSMADRMGARGLEHIGSHKGGLTKSRFFAKLAALPGMCRLRSGPRCAFGERLAGARENLRHLQAGPALLFR
jgi:hypothetical protein